MVTVKKLQAWLAGLDDDDLVGVEEGGLALEVAKTKEYYEIGGIVDDMPEVRFEVPVLLYATIDRDALEPFTDPLGGDAQAVKERAWAHLMMALRDEDAAPHPLFSLTIPGFDDCRIYLTDHEFSVNSANGLSLASAEGDDASFPDDEEGGDDAKS